MKNILVFASILEKEKNSIQYMLAMLKKIFFFYPHKRVRRSIFKMSNKIQNVKRVLSHIIPK